MKIAKAMLNNAGLKIIALILSVATWFYVFNEIERDKPKESMPPVEIHPSFGEIVSNSLDVTAIFVGKPPEGYRLLDEEVKIEPAYFVVAAPKSVLKDIDGIETEPIDISRLKKTTVVETGISPIAPGVETNKLRAKVTIPVVKIEASLKAE